MEALQAKLDEANTMLVKEREAAKTIVEAAPVVQETQVIVEDTEKIDCLKTEVQELKVCSLTTIIVQNILIICLTDRFNNNTLPDKLKHLVVEWYNTCSHIVAYHSIFL